MPVCSSFDCNRIIDQRDLMSPVMFRSHLEFKRKILTQHRQRQQDKKHQIDLLELEQKKQQEAILSRVISANKLQKNEIQSVVIHKGASTESPLSESRILNYLDHLHENIEKAASLQSIDDCVQDEHYDALRKLDNIQQCFTVNPELLETSDQLCGLCKGGCCVAGNDHAYLSTFTMRQQLDQNPDWTKQDLFEKYTDLISTYSMEGSCINHTSQGCALPRELRSNICNAFYCKDLKAYQQAKQQSSSDKLLVIQRENCYSAWINPDDKNEIADVLIIEQGTVKEVNYSSGKIKSR
jgi:hypothetical protein